MEPYARPPCPYGAACYRRNPQHRAEYSHPTSLGASSSTAPNRPQVAEVIELGDTTEEDEPALDQSPKRARLADKCEDAASNSLLSSLRREREARHPPASTPALPLGFQLTKLNDAWVDAGLVSHAANTSTIDLQAMLGPSALQGATELQLHNYMIDLDYLVAECPAIRSVPRVVVVHGDGQAPDSLTARRDPERFVCIRPPCERYGTHHSKAIFVLRSHSLSVHVTTANFIKTDLENKTNATWSAHFPAHVHASLPLSPSAAAVTETAAAPTAPDTPDAGFGADLFTYLSALKACGMRPAADWTPHQPGAWAAYELGWVAQYSYVGCTARLIASIPGRHTGPQLDRWGHLRIRALLDAEAAARPSDALGSECPLVMQFSSLSSPGTNTTWMSELRRSFCGSGAPPAIEVVFPTAAQVGEALEGWVAGSSIPCDAQNAGRLRHILAELTPRGRLCKWDGGDGPHGGASGRLHALPHIKTYCRYRRSDRSLGWAIVASHNLSQAAWGKCEKKGQQREHGHCCYPA